MSDINEALKAAAHIYSDRLKAEKEARENPRKTRRDNADAFAEHLEQQMQARREESGIEDLLG